MNHLLRHVQRKWHSPCPSRYYRSFSSTPPNNDDNDEDNITKSSSSSSSSSSTCSSTTTSSQLSTISSQHSDFFKKDFIPTSLMGIGQVLFLHQHTPSSLLVLGGLAYGNPWLASMALYGSAIGTSTAYIAGLDRNKLNAGLYGYNGCLVGCASVVFLGTDTTMVTPLWMTTMGASLCPLVTVAFDHGIRTTPQWTLAFNAITLSMLIRTKPLLLLPSSTAEEVGGDAITNSTATTTCAVETTSMLDSMAYLLTTGSLKGISQIFVVESTMTGFMVLSGISLYSPQLAMHALLGSTIGTIIGTLTTSTPYHDVAIGLWGFNSALTSMAIGVFFVPTRQAMYLSMIGATTTAGLFGTLKMCMGEVLGVPALTVPFCVVATGCYWLAGNVPGLILAKNPHSPEKNEA